MGRATENSARICGNQAGSLMFYTCCWWQVDDGAESDRGEIGKEEDCGKFRLKGSGEGEEGLTPQWKHQTD